MSFSNPNTFIQYTADGIQTRFAINFYIFEGENELTAKVLDSDLNEVVSPFSIDHTNYPASEVVFVDAPADGHIVLIERTTALMQMTSFMKGSFPAEAVEETFDRAFMVAQENAAQISRAVIDPVVGPTYEERLDEVEADIADQATSLQALDDRLVEVENVDVTGLDAQVQQHATDINQLQIDQGQLQIDLDLVEAGLANTDLAVAALVTAVNGKQDKPTLTILSAANTYNAVDNGIYVVKSDDVTIELPALVSGLMVTVKMDNIRANCIISSGNSIDGFGANYQLMSAYEAVKLVCDGTQWYII